MNPLQSRLAGLRRRLHLVTLIRGASLVCIAVLGSVFISGLIDWTVHLPAAIRALLLLSILAAAVAVLYRFLILPLSAHVDDLSLALKVEEQYPVLNDALASTVQFLEQDKETPATGSNSLRQEAINRALRLAQGCDFGRVVNTRGLPLTGGLAGLALVGAIVLALMSPSVVRPAMLRLVHPFGEHEWETQTRLTKLDYRPRIAADQPFRIRGEIAGVIPESKKAVIEFQGLVRSDVPREYTIHTNDNGTGFFIADLDMTGQERDFRFRVKVNDAQSPRREGLWHSVRVSRPPELIAVDGLPPPFIELYPPAYTGLPSPEELPPGSWQVEAFEGSRLHLHATASRPIVKAWIQHKPADGRQMLAAQMGLIGHADGFAALAVHVGTQQGYARIPALIDGDGQHFGVEFRPWLSGNYILHIEDDEELPKQYTLTLNIIPDPKPLVHLRQPASNLRLLPTAEINLEVLAEDDLFALRSVYLEYYRKDSQGRILDPEPKKLFFYHHLQAENMAQMLPGLSPVPMQLPLPDVQARPKHLQIEHRWSLQGLVNVGDILVIQACADDFNDVVAFNIPGKSHRVELRIVDRVDLDGFLDQEQAKIHQNLLRLRVWQEDALKKTIEVEQKWKNTGELTEKEMKLLMEAQQIQKQIEARIGATKDEGLRKELNQLKDMIRDNQIDSSGAKDRIDLLQKELERLAKEHIGQIPPRLNDALQKMGAVEEKQPDEKTEAGLQKARDHQEEVQKTLDDLLGHLSRWADIQEIKGELHAILKEQEELQGDTENLNKKYAPDDNQWKAALQRIAELQRRLGERTQRLLQKMERVAKEKAITDPNLKEMLDKAAKIGKDGMVAEEIKDTQQQLELALPGGVTSLPERMQHVSDQLRSKMVNKAIGQQEESIKTLKKMAEALQENRQDDLERLVKKQKQAKDDLDDLAERLEKLQKKVAEANKIADPEERKQALKKLAEEQRKLQEEAERRAREMSPLRAGGAAQAMRQAAEEMDKALKRLEEGEDPEEHQQEALERLQQAQEKVQQAQRQAQDELEREQLARIADHIKGLKKRQQAAIDESNRLHKLILDAGWGENQMQRSYSQHEETQQNLAAETARYAKQLEGAKVFSLILKKAGEDMERAVASMVKRRGKAAFREEAFPFDDEIVKDEQRSHKDITRHQKHAHGRLERLIEALEEELQKKTQEARQDQKKQKQGDKEGQNGDGQQQGGIRAQDGIPAMAQLKVLRGEQADLHERTKEFAQEHPKLDQLPPEAQAELNALHADQEAIFLLFQEMLAAVNQGEKK